MTLHEIFRTVTDISLFGGILANSLALMYTNKTIKILRKKVYGE